MDTITKTDIEAIIILLTLITITSCISAIILSSINEKLKKLK